MKWFLNPCAQRCSKNSGTEGVVKSLHRLENRSDHRKAKGKMAIFQCATLLTTVLFFLFYQIKVVNSVDPVNFTTPAPLSRKRKGSKAKRIRNDPDILTHWERENTCIVVSKQKGYLVHLYLANKREEYCVFCNTLNLMRVLPSIL